MFRNFKSKLVITLAISLLVPLVIDAQTIDGEVDFNVDPSYDSQGRKELTAVLVKSTDQLYFYADKIWWEELSRAERQSLDVVFYNLGIEFERKIYPTLTKAFGSEPKPGIDGSEIITVLLHPMISDAGGYYNTGDIYSRFEYPKSNERELLYLNSRYIDKPEAKAFLAHEFTHLITINQKNLLRGVNEEIWLNEARAEYSATFLGYNDVYRGSILERRVNEFLRNSQISLTEWLNKKEDYGAINLFTQYLVDHYGVKILVDSLQSDYTGIESVNYALTKNNYGKNFSQIFSDWAVTLLVNDCNLGDEYCYLNKHLQDFHITPTFYYLPRAETVMSNYHDTTYWGLNWHRFLGGGSDLVLEFDGLDEVVFKVPYLVCDFNNSCSVKFVSLNEEQKGEITLSGFGAEYSSLTIIPFVESKTSGFNGHEESISFSWKITVDEKTEKEKGPEAVNQLLAQIEELKRKIAEYEAKIAALKGLTPVSCNRFDNDLYYGIWDSVEVSCLQQFLKEQGPDIYPEGLVTGNFLSLTQAAVIRFQEKYAEEILYPLDLEKGTGYFGPATRNKINSLKNS
ncbi:hypothetical protein AMJ48_01225 [Parcubacteria bacterium DG_74_1]|nr:MAG: hypothetical protein AMJ48_01225 [Parcubacteria bacterium DG_74_1]